MNRGNKNNASMTKTFAFCMKVLSFHLVTPKHKVCVEQIELNIEESFNRIIIHLHDPYSHVFNFPQGKGLKCQTSKIWEKHYKV